MPFEGLITNILFSAAIVAVGIALIRTKQFVQMAIGASLIVVVAGWAAQGGQTLAGVLVMGAVIVSVLGGSALLRSRKKRRKERKFNDRHSNRHCDNNCCSNRCNCACHQR